MRQHNYIYLEPQDKIEEAVRHEGGAIFGSLRIGTVVLSLEYPEQAEEIAQACWLLQNQLALAKARKAVDHG